MITLVCGNLIWKCEVELASVQFEMNIRYRKSNCNAVPPQSSFRYRRRWKGLLQGFHPCHGFRQRAVLSKCRWPERCLDRSMIKILLVEGWPLRAAPVRFSSTWNMYNASSVKTSFLTQSTWGIWSCDMSHQCLMIWMGIWFWKDSCEIANCINRLRMWEEITFRQCVLKWKMALSLNHWSVRFD
jgi:hypothetical protein